MAYHSMNDFLLEVENMFICNKMQKATKNESLDMESRHV